MIARAIASTIMWMTYLGMVAGLAGTMGNWIILLAFVLMIPLVAMTGMMWGMFEKEGETSKQQATLDDVEKRKRERLDNVLRDLSDDDLLRLKHRLATGTISDENLYANLVGDDGELVDYSK